MANHKDYLDTDNDERFTVDGASESEFIVITRQSRNRRTGKFEFEESVCIPRSVWEYIVKDAKP